MSDPYLGEIKIFTGNFAPNGWALCNGQLLSIAQNTALFSLLGTNFGGNGTSTFGLPNLQGTLAVGQGNGIGLTPRVVGETFGTATVTLTSAQVAAHQHQLVGHNGDFGELPQPLSDATLARSANARAYGPATNLTALAPQALSAGNGGGQPHDNMMPCLGLTFIIAMQGIYPPRG